MYIYIYNHLVPLIGERGTDSIDPEINLTTYRPNMSDMVAILATKN